MGLRTLESLGHLAGKRVLVRLDLNVPIENATILDDGRIRAALPTLSWLCANKAKIVVLSHLGRPDGEPNPAYSLQPVATRLGELLGQPVAFSSQTIGSGAEGVVASLSDGQVALLENVRFTPDETSKQTSVRQKFADALATLGDAVVSDGFGVVHRKQASVYELPALLPSAGGRLIETELGVLTRLTQAPEAPYTVILGGSKVSDKLGVIDHLLPRVNNLVIGGGMVFTFLAAMGYQVGKSLLERDHIDTARRYLERARELGVNVVLPTDIVVADRFAPDAQTEIVSAHHMEASRLGSDILGLDIGPDSARQFGSVIAASRTAFWNGPMGVFEMAPFAAGTQAVALALTRVSGLSVVGGGDSAAAVRQLGFTDESFGHVSTGGGASLEFLEGKSLPGLEVLGWK